MAQVKAGEIDGGDGLSGWEDSTKSERKGERSIVHGNRGCPSPQKIPKEEEERIITFIRKRYLDFGPTFASEKLGSVRGIEIGREAQAMDGGLWALAGEESRRGRIYQWRERKHSGGDG